MLADAVKSWEYLVLYVAAATIVSAVVVNFAGYQARRERPVEREHSVVATPTITLFFVAIYVLARFDLGRLTLSPDADICARLAGSGLVAFAAVINVAGRIALGRHWSDQVEMLEQHRLVRSWPFSWSRHPLYGSPVVLATGIGLLAVNPLVQRLLRLPEHGADAAATDARSSRQDRPRTARMHAGLGGVSCAPGHDAAFGGAHARALVRDGAGRLPHGLPDQACRDRRVRSPGGGGTVACRALLAAGCCFPDEPHRCLSGHAHSEARATVIGQHVVSDAIAWLCALLIAVLIHRWRFRNRFAATFEKLSAGYFLSLSAGGLLGAFGFGTWNAHLSGQPGIGKSILGGLVGAILLVEIYKRRHGIHGSTGVVLAVPLAVGVALGRLGCFEAGLADFTYGTATQRPWAVDLGDGVPRHPVQLYESVSMAATAILVTLGLARRSRWALESGFYIVVGIYAAQRFAWEFLKPYGPLIGPLNLFHVLCTLLIAYAILMVTLARSQTT